MGCTYSSNKEVKCCPLPSVDRTTAPTPNATYAKTQHNLPAASKVPSNNASWQREIPLNSIDCGDVQSTKSASERGDYSLFKSEAASRIGQAESLTTSMKSSRASQQFPLLRSNSIEEIMTCCICYDTMPSSSTPTSLHSANPCDSAHFVCRGCAYMYLKTKVEEKAVASNLTCPGNCGEFLTVEDVRSFLDSADENDHAAWHVLLAKFNEAHEAANAVETARDRRLRRWLPSATDMAADMKFALWRCGHNARRCPGCKTVIEKNGGCQHMTCRECCHEFWWCCGQAYRGKHKLRLCAPSSSIRSLVQHRSLYWGPNVPVRAVTKVTASCVGLGLGVTAAALSVVAVPLYLGGSALSTKSGFKDWRRGGQRRPHRTAVERPVTPQRVRRALHNLRYGARAGGLHGSVFTSSSPLFALRLLRPTAVTPPAMGTNEVPKKLVLEVPLGAKAVAARRAKFAVAAVAAIAAVALAVGAMVVVIVVTMLAIALVVTRATDAIGLKATVAVILLQGGLE